MIPLIVDIDGEECLALGVEDTEVSAIKIFAIIPNPEWKIKLKLFSDDPIEGKAIALAPGETLSNTSFIEN